jgi:hypothetical protein
VAWSSLVLIPVGYFTTTDFDNMLCPFPGGEDLVGIWWREAMGICTRSQLHTHTRPHTHDRTHAGPDIA